MLDGGAAVLESRGFSQGVRVTCICSGLALTAATEVEPSMADDNGIITGKLLTYSFYFLTIG